MPAASLPKFMRVKVSQLGLNSAFPRREVEPDMSLLKSQIVEYGILSPLVVRLATSNPTNFYLVLDGRRRLQALWELQNEGHSKLVNWVPCYCLDSNTPLSDLKLFIILNGHAPLGAGEYERAMEALESANKPKKGRR